MENNKVVFYHTRCLDGFSSAWVAWKKFGEEADYIPVSDHHHYPEWLVEGKTVYMIDFVFSEEIFNQIKNNAEKVVALDHHETVEEVTKSADEYKYSVDKCGSTLAWEYFFPEEEIPLFLSYVEAIDLYNLEKLENTKEVLAFLDSQEMNYANWSGLFERFNNEEDRNEIFKIGSYILSFKENIINSILSKAYEVSFEGYRALAVNCTAFISDVGHELYTEKPPISIIWSERRYGIKVSLRSDGSVDVGEIAKKYDGGGHRAAAAFKLPLSEKDNLPWHRID